MKQKNKLNRILIVAITIVTLILISITSIRGNSIYQSFDRGFYSFFSMIRYGVIEYPIETIASVIDDFSSFWSLRYENDQLRMMLENAAKLEVTNKELRHEVEELKLLNELNTVYSQYQLINATIKSRSFENWNMVVTIDKGSLDGVVEGDGVVSSRGVLGRIISVSENQSVVSLITANDSYSQVGIKIEIDANQYVQGILSDYNHESGLFTVQLLDSTSTITKGMNVSTSGIGGIYPSGLYVGQVEMTSPVPDGVGIAVYVRSEVDFNDLKYVAVVKLP